MATIAPERPRSTKLSEGPKPPGRERDRIFKWVTFGAGLLVLLILLLIFVSTINQSWDWFSTRGLRAVFSAKWSPKVYPQGTAKAGQPIPGSGFGAWALIFGTLYTSFVAVLIAVPLSVGIALFTTDVGPRWLRNPVGYVIDLLAVVPSVVFGLWGVFVLASPIRNVYQHIADFFSPVPVLNKIFTGNPLLGTSVMTAGLILAIMITPIITSLTREVLATVPIAQKEGALALGATRWEVVRGAILPHSRSGIVASVMIGLGRAMGETIAVALVIGAAVRVSPALFSPNNTLAAIIAQNFGEAQGIQRSALIGLGVVLFVITLLVNAMARAVLSRGERRLAAGK